MITVDEVKALGSAFWKVTGGGGDAREAVDLFINPGILLPDGAWVDLETHQMLHHPLCDESHEWTDLSVRTLSDDPQRVLATGTVHWEATIRASGERIISDVGEQWIIQRGADDRLRWTHYWSDSITFAEGSAQLRGVEATR